MAANHAEIDNSVDDDLRWAAFLIEHSRNIEQHIHYFQYVLLGSGGHHSKITNETHLIGANRLDALDSGRSIVRLERVRELFGPPLLHKNFELL